MYHVETNSALKWAFGACNSILPTITTINYFLIIVQRTSSNPKLSRFLFSFFSDPLLQCQEILECFYHQLLNKLEQLTPIEK